MKHDLQNYKNRKPDNTFSTLNTTRNQPPKKSGTKTCSWPFDKNTSLSDLHSVHY